MEKVKAIDWSREYTRRERGGLVVALPPAAVASVYVEARERSGRRSGQGLRGQGWWIWASVKGQRVVRASGSWI